MGFLEKLHALASTARLPNLPSVVGNVFLGLAIAHRLAVEPGIVPAALCMLAGVFLYLAGNFLNDWADRDWDAAHRPERALPRRLFQPGSYLGVGGTCLALGLASAAAVNPLCLIVALALAAMILLYTAIHKRSSWSVLPMGLCRALLPVLGFAGIAAASRGLHPALIASAAGIFCHIVGLSLSARGESAAARPPGTAARLVWLWFPAAALSMVIATSHGLSLPHFAVLPAALAYLAWIAVCLTLFRKPVPRLVSNLLAGIPLIDWIVLLPLGMTLAAFTPFAALCVSLPPLAFLAARALQRLAPAT
jgi:4-hydroxybenzoate polyprenyltransferase